MFIFIDSDQTFEVKDIEKLINLKVCDVAVGILARSNNTPTSHPVNIDNFVKGKDSRLLYGSTGFMLIRRSICSKIIPYLADEYNCNSPRFIVGEKDINIIPFFAERFVENELSPNSTRLWLGEDYSFSWLVRKVGGIIRGFMSDTLGHQVAQIVYLKVPDELKDQKKYFNQSSL